MAAKANQPDLSEFYKLSKPKRPPCQVGFALTQLEEAEAGKLAAACAADREIITAKAIEEWLAARGHQVNTNRISNHRRGVCSCNG